MNKIQRWGFKTIWRISMGLFELIYGKRPMQYVSKPNDGTLLSRTTFADGSSRYIVYRTIDEGETIAISKDSFTTGGIAKVCDKWVNATTAFAKFLHVQLY